MILELANDGQAVDIESVKNVSDLTDEQMTALVKNAEK